eukprot:scaffold20.g7648.t1
MAPCASISQLPSELLVLDVLSRLDAADLSRALGACKNWHGFGEAAWRAACFRRWRRWSEIAQAASPEDVVWKRQFELLQLRDDEASCLPDVPRIRRSQPVVTERHRSILVEWLCEVSFDWSLESTLPFKAVIYLDYYLEAQPVDELSRFQLIGLACLRAAMGDARKPTALAADEAKSMDPQRFAYISDDTYTAEEVEECTQLIAALVPAHLKAAPNAKMFLRSFWYRATLKEVVSGEEMHIYTLASFLLQLSLVDLASSAYPASLRAAAALSLALAYFGKPEWPAALRGFGSYEAAELGPCRMRLAELQAITPTSQLRPLWRQAHESHGYDEFKPQWDRCLRIFACPNRMLAAREGETESPPPEDSIAPMMLE